MRKLSIHDLQEEVDTGSCRHRCRENLSIHDLQEEVDHIFSFLILYILQLSIHDLQKEVDPGDRSKKGDE